MLPESNVHLDIIAGGQWTDIPEIEYTTVRVFLAIVPVKHKRNSRFLADRCIYRLKTLDQFFKRDLLQQGKVEVLREAIVSEVASLESRAAFECQDRLEVRVRNRREEPSKAIIPFAHVLQEAASALLCQLDRSEMLR